MSNREPSHTGNTVMKKTTSGFACTAQHCQVLLLLKMIQALMHRPKPKLCCSWFTRASCQTRSLLNNGLRSYIQKRAETHRAIIQPGVWSTSAMCYVEFFRVGRWICSGCSEGSDWQDRDRKDALQFCMSNSKQLLAEQSRLYLHHN